MRVQDKIIVVTGAAGGIGAAMVARFLEEGARIVVATDLRQDKLDAHPQLAGAQRRACDVTDPEEVTQLVNHISQKYGCLDILCSNAGILPGLGLEANRAQWDSAFSVNVLAHAHAARAAVPVMLAQGGGWLVNTVSAAGLLTNPGDVVYSTTKHAAMGLAEWISMTYGDRGIGVSVICPMGVATPMLLDPLEAGSSHAAAVARSGTVIGPDQVAAAVVRALDREEFLILPHPEVATYWAQKAADPDRWLRGMRRMVAGLGEG
jgi:NAD(P)-dependent dehydrogenase (short-subunit alcohol dehydrogenase family)